MRRFGVEKAHGARSPRASCYKRALIVFLTLFAVPTAYAILARKTRSPQHVSRIVDRLLAGGEAAGTAGGTAAAHAPHQE